MVDIHFYGHVTTILQVLFQIDEGKESKDANGSVNYIKMMMLHEQIDNLEILQSDYFRDEPNFLIQKLLVHEFQIQSKVNDTHLYRLSKTISDSEKNKK